MDRRTRPSKQVRSISRSVAAAEPLSCDFLSTGQALVFGPFQGVSSGRVAVHGRIRPLLRRRFEEEMLWTVGLLDVRVLRIRRSR